MLPRISAVRHLGEYRLQISFTDGAMGLFDFRARVVGRGGVFKPLEDVEVFKQVVVDPEAGTVVWPNHVDLCPDVLYRDASGENLIDVS